MVLTFLVMSRTAVAMLCAGAAVVAIGLWAARGVDKVVALTYLCFAVPLAVFGALHLSNEKSLLGLVPAYMPWRWFWVYFVGLALLAAAVSMATQIQVRWSGLLFGLMMFLFVAMLHLPGAIAMGGRIPWTIVFRETSFGGGGLVLAGVAMGGSGRRLVAVGRVLIAIAAIVFGVLHFLHPLGLPGVPLEKQMPEWVPGRTLIDYLTGAGLVAAGGCFLLGRRVRVAATYVGAWIVLMVVVIYVPVMIGALGEGSSAVQVEGINYFADTLLFGGVILSVGLADKNRRQTESVVIWRLGRRR